ncbi:MULTISPECIES: hypothetical protein [unclassified Sphingomonas]|uniref:hypothetical protein n=1 Tax=unclassified Sphingomonas TaxID=196159 RepID=UPI0012E37EEB|nr:MULTISPECIES: hypothetical protein [unclassified Sphingomonas]MCH4893641.1 hypothetical protein [Sphingomonas sp. SFZ2018-12]
MAWDVERAVSVTSLLRPSASRSVIFDHLPAIFQWVLPALPNDAVIAACLDQRPLATRRSIEETWPPIGESAIKSLIDERRSKKPRALKQRSSNHRAEIMR